MDSRPLDQAQLPPWLRPAKIDPANPVRGEQQEKRAWILDIYVQPGAKHAQVLGIHNERLKIKVQAPPVDGAANEAVLAALAQYLGIKVRELEIIAGHTSRQKSVVISQIENSVLKKLLKAL